MPKSAKITILGAFLGATSLAYWIYIEQIFFQPPDAVQIHFWSLKTVLVFCVLSGALATLYGLVAFIVGEGLWAYIILAAGSLPFFVPIQNFSPLVLGAFGVFVLSAIFMRARIASENAGRIRISVEKVLPQHLSVFLLALPLLVAAVFYISPAPKQIKDYRIPRNFFQKMIAPIEAVFRQQTDAPLGELNKTLETLSPEILPKELAQGALRFQGLQIPFLASKDEKTAYSEFSDALYEAVNARIASTADLSPKTQKYIATALAISVFFTARFILIPVGWAAIFATIILWNILTYVGFVKIGTVQVEKEVIGL